MVGNAEFHFSDAVEFLRHLDLAPALIFADPPFNIGVSYTQTNDNKPPAEYREWTREWLLAASSVLADDGSLWVNIADKWAADVVTILRDECGLKMENWCIWHFRFGVCQPHRFIVSKTHVLWFSKGDPIVNTEAALVPSDRAAVYGDWRSPTGKRMDLDVWGFDQFCSS